MTMAITALELNEDISIGELIGMLEQTSSTPLFDLGKGNRRYLQFQSHGSLYRIHGIVVLPRFPGHSVKSSLTGSV